MIFDHLGLATEQAKQGEASGRVELPGTEGQGCPTGGLFLVIRVGSWLLCRPADSVTFKDSPISEPLSKTTLQLREHLNGYDGHGVRMIVSGSERSRLGRDAVQAHGSEPG